MEYGDRARKMKDVTVLGLVMNAVLTAAKIIAGVWGRSSAMIADGLLKKEDPSVLAFAYTAPITALIHQCDREPEKEAEIMQEIEAFLQHFINTYRC